MRVSLPPWTICKAMIAWTYAFVGYSPNHVLTLRCFLHVHKLQCSHGVYLLVSAHTTPTSLLNMKTLPQMVNHFCIFSLQISSTFYIPDLIDISSIELWNDLNNPLSFWGLPIYCELVDSKKQLVSRVPKYLSHLSKTSHSQKI